jgi:hypothetical protein
MALDDVWRAFAAVRFDLAEEGERFGSRPPLLGAIREGKYPLPSTFTI